MKASCFFWDLILPPRSRFYRLHSSMYRVDRIPGNHSWFEVEHLNPSIRDMVTSDDTRGNPRPENHGGNRLVGSKGYDFRGAEACPVDTPGA
jgi:hypothetical protein